jgi:catechol 2,3-dioxygenase-like lactoylglutathione lyase family enzyme
MGSANGIKLNAAAPTFLVSDVAATASWYFENLGFELAGHVPNEEPFAYASLMRDRVEIMLLSLEGYEKPDLTSLRTSGLWDAYIRMDGVEKSYESVKGRDFIKMDLTKQSYGDTEFEVRDPNGYILVFGG